MLTNLTILFLGMVVGMTVAVILFGRIKIFDFEKRKENAEKIITESRAEAEKLKAEAAEKTKSIKERTASDSKKREERIEKLNEALKNKESFIEKKELRNNDLRLEIVTAQEDAQFKQEQIKKFESEISAGLSKKTGLKHDAVKEQILAAHKQEVEAYGEDRLVKLEEDTKENATKIAKKILQNSMQRLSSPTSVETKTVLIKVPRDFIKGKIVGKNAENLAEIERLFPEVDIIFNDLPNTISVACYNLVLRRTVHLIIEKLITFKGVIDVKVIGLINEESKKDLEKELYQVGKTAVERLGMRSDNKELLGVVGRMQYRTSYGQNIMKHSMEVAWMAAMLAYEARIDYKTCKIAGFLHDLGKAIDQDPAIQETHDRLTKQLMEKYGFKPEEVHAAWTHHEAEPPKTPEAWSVIAADAVSASRPGARQESLGQYIDRMQALEEKGQSFEGVKKAFAISAGRELRVMVDPEMVNDEAMKPLATNIAEKIEKELSYPGKVKVNVIRRTDATEIAK
ncbi:MAG: Rnase Y domain-containing protein [Candidatus Gracilibacteria bacterium]